MLCNKCFYYYQFFDPDNPNGYYECSKRVTDPSKCDQFEPEKTMAEPSTAFQHNGFDVDMILGNDCYSCKCLEPTFRWDMTLHSDLPTSASFYISCKKFKECLTAGVFEDD